MRVVSPGFLEVLGVTILVGRVLAFSVSARTREFGVRLAAGATPRDLLAGVLWDGARIAAIGITSRWRSPKLVRWF